MVKDRRAVESPRTHLSGLNVRTDRRRDRRSLTVPELLRLLETTGRGPDRYGMTGAQRALLYRLALETGLRSGELRSLTRASFDLEADPPSVTVEAAYSKHRRQDTLPLRPGLAAELGSFLALLAPGAKVFRIPIDHHDAAALFREDVEAAGIPYRDDSGRVADFHSLRHTFISNLAAGGVHPKTAQQLARHSTITLTMDRYTHTFHEELSDALAVLPDLTGRAGQAARATGTDGPGVLASCLARQGSRVETSGGAGRQPAAAAVESQSLESSAVSAGQQGPGSVCTSGGGPGLQNQWRV